MNTVPLSSPPQLQALMLDQYVKCISRKLPGKGGGGGVISKATFILNLKKVEVKL